jgi:hypothetical protein
MRSMLDDAARYPADRHALVSLHATGPSFAERHATLLMLFFAGYIVSAIYFFIAYAEPYLAAMDLYAPRMLADSVAYQTICISGEYYFDWTTLRDIGPCAGLGLTSYNMAMLSIGNAALITTMVVWAALTYDRSWKAILALSIINPITFLSLFGPNKEIFGAASVLGLMIFVKRRSLISLVVCLVMALFSRIPSFIATFVFCLLMVAFLPKRRQLIDRDVQKYRFVTAVMVIVISLIVLRTGGDLQYSLLGDVSAAEDISQATSISLSVDGLSSIGLYPLVYLIRLMLNIYSGVVGLNNLGAGGVGIYYGIGIAGSSLMFIIMTAVLVIHKIPEDLRKNAVSYNLILFVIFTTLFLCVSPMIQHRYFYPLYFVVLIFITQPTGGKPATIPELLTGQPHRSAA